MDIKRWGLSNQQRRIIEFANGEYVKYSDYEALRQQLTKPAVEVLIEAAKAVVDRWETPLWEDAPATAGYIYRLRDALNAKPADHIVDVNKMVSVADDTISVSKGEWEAMKGALDIAYDHLLVHWSEDDMKTVCPLNKVYAAVQNESEKLLDNQA
jgi:hypothetical protein